MDSDIIVAGLDPSLTSFGVVWGSDATMQHMAIKSKPCGVRVVDRMRRLEQIVSQMDLALREAQPRVVMIEGYAFGSTSGKVADRAELGGLTRWHCVDYTPLIFEVAPSTLKKFITGGGKADKDQVLKLVFKNWGVDVQTSDEADAYGLWRMAMVAVGAYPPDNKKQTEAVNTALGGANHTQASLRAALEPPAF